MTRAVAANRRTMAGIVLLPVLLFAGCGEPVPRERASYVGVWEGAGVFLAIEADGSVHYRRVRGGGRTSIDAPLAGFEREDFEVGVGPITTTFDVSVPPRHEGGRWIMVVDGVTLVRTDVAAAAADGRW